MSWHQPPLPVRTLRKACLFPIWACGSKETMSAVSERMGREHRGLGNSATSQSLSPEMQMPLPFFFSDTASIVSGTANYKVY